LKREIIKTLDGSVTIHLPEMKESYHSKFGAIQEAYHVFIKNGLALFEGRPVSILEIGFGTGLNAFITYLESVKSNQQIQYTGVEAYPIAMEEVQQLNYVDQLNAEKEAGKFNLMHSADWDKPENISDDFSLLKRKQFFNEINDNNSYDLIYFDAFGYHAQPELWSVEIFKLMKNALHKEGVLVTYACRNSYSQGHGGSGFCNRKTSRASR
jgi:tRNA U34 5-methylaminomethyl-2-thiouridine-forming methyltransferase MnmC